MSCALASATSSDSHQGAQRKRRRGLDRSREYPCPLSGQESLGMWTRPEAHLLCRDGRLVRARRHEWVIVVPPLIATLAGMTVSLDSSGWSRARRTRRILRFAAGTCVFFAAVLIAGVIAIGLLLSAPTRAIIGAPPADIP